MTSWSTMGDLAQQASVQMGLDAGLSADDIAGLLGVPVREVKKVVDACAAAAKPALPVPESREGVAPAATVASEPHRQPPRTRAVRPEPDETAAPSPDGDLEARCAIAREESTRGWSARRTALLPELAAAGHTSSQIAAFLGGNLSRNAVIGKIHRLSVPHNTARGARGPRTAPSRAPRAKAAPKAKKVRQWAGWGDTPAAPGKPPWLPKEPPPAPAMKRLTIFQVTELTCRWPVGDPRDADFCFCGITIVKAPYCEYHRSIAYQPVTRRQRYGASDGGFGSSLGAAERSMRE